MSRNDDEIEFLREHIDRQVHWIVQEIRLSRRMLMATQADIDALTQALTDLGNTLVADDSAIQTELTRLQGQGVDVTGLSAAVDALKTDVEATTALVPAATTPTPPATPPTA